MKTSIKSVFLLGLFGMLLLVTNGCQLAAVLILWNESNSELQVERPNEHPLFIKSKAKHKLPFEGVDVLGQKYDVVIQKDGKRLGYKISFLTLRQLQKFRFHRIEFQIDDKNEIYVLKVDSLTFDALANQPSGFPVSPVLLEEPK
jgi:hypothetical protein